MSPYLETAPTLEIDREALPLADRLQYHPVRPNKPKDLRGLVPPLSTTDKNSSKDQP